MFNFATVYWPLGTTSYSLYYPWCSQNLLLCIPQILYMVQIATVGYMQPPYIEIFLQPTI